MTSKACCNHKAEAGMVSHVSIARTRVGTQLARAVAARERKTPARRWHDHSHSKSRRHHVVTMAVVEAPPEWTLDQIAGLAFSFFMLASYFGAKYVDQYVAASQRKQVGVCVRCGGLYEGEGIACLEQECPNKGTQPPAQPNQPPPS